MSSNGPHGPDKLRVLALYRLFARDLSSIVHSYLLSSKLRVAGSNPAGVAISYFRSIRFKDLARS